MKNAKPFLKWGCGTTLLFVGILAGAWGLRENQVNRLLQAQRDEAKRLGISLNPEDYNKTDFPDRENAALKYAAVVQKLKPFERDLEKLRADLSSAKGVTDEELDRRIARFRPDFPETLAASKLPHYRWKRDWDRGFMMEHQELSLMRNLNHLIIAESRLAARKGDKARAAEFARAAIRIGRQVRREPMLVGQLVSESMLNSSMWNAARVAVQFNDPALTKTLIEDIDKVEPMRPQSWIGAEMLIYDHVAKNANALPPEFFDGGTTGDQVAQAVFKVPIVRREGAAKALRDKLDFHKDISATEDPAKWNDITTTWDNRIRTRIGGDLSDKFASMIGGVFGGYMYGGTERNQRMIRLILGYPAEAVDPRTGNKFQVKRTKDGVEVFANDFVAPAPSTPGGPPPAVAATAQGFGAVRKGRVLTVERNDRGTGNWN